MIFLIGFLLRYYFYTHFRISSGSVLAPFIVLYTLGAPSLFFIFVLALIASLFSIDIFIKKYLVYGWRLFYLALTISLIISSVLYFIFNPDFSIIFFSIIAGIIAYNYHKELMSGAHYMKITGFWFGEFVIIYVFGFIIYSL